MASSPFALVSTRLIFLLGITGILISFAKGKNFLLLYLFLLSDCFIIFFQIKTRYLTPLIPFVIIFSSFAIYELYRNLRERHWAGSLTILGFITVLNALSLANPLTLTRPTVYETYYAIARNYQAFGAIEKAKHYLFLTLRGDPQNLSAYNELGIVLLREGNYAKALPYFEKALQIDPHAVKPKLNLKLCQELIAKTKE